MLTLGIDLGTSGVRLAVIDAIGGIVMIVRSEYRLPQTPETDATVWWEAVDEALHDLADRLGSDMFRIHAIAVAGTSGSMVLIDGALRAVTPALMYHSGGFDAEAGVIDGHAPPGAITRGPNGALARLLYLQSLSGADRATHVCHQADMIAALLRGKAGLSDDTNALKLGWDPESRRWPGWFEEAGVRTGLLPKVLAVGAAFGTVSSAMALRFRLSPQTVLIAGATDSIAAFLATGAAQTGDAVTSLGSTLVVKLLSDKRIDDASRGVYSHRVRRNWLVGGASNTGGAVLRHYFTEADLPRLSALIDADQDTGLDYYPLIRPGERFPINDPHHPPRLTPRPTNDALFLHGLLEGIARIEAQSYKILVSLDAPAPHRILTVGGGAKNAVWANIRARWCKVPIMIAKNTEASVGMARLAAGLV